MHPEAVGVLKPHGDRHGPAGGLAHDDAVAVDAVAHPGKRPGGWAPREASSEPAGLALERQGPRRLVLAAGTPDRRSGGSREPESDERNE